MGTDVERRESPRGGGARKGDGGAGGQCGGEGHQDSAGEGGTLEEGGRTGGGGRTCERADPGNPGDRVGVRGRKRKVQDLDLREVVLADWNSPQKECRPLFSDFR